jgi:predicted nucleotidyltransferase
LIELERPPKIGLLGLIELQEQLGDLLGAPADVVVKSNLRKRIGQRLLAGVVPV